MSVINKHQNDKINKYTTRLYKCHCGSNWCCVLFLLHTTAYPYDLKCVTQTTAMSRTRHSDILVYPTLLCDKPCRVNGFWLYMYIVLANIIAAILWLAQDPIDMYRYDVLCCISCVMFMFYVVPGVGIRYIIHTSRIPKRATVMWNCNEWLLWNTCM